MTGRLSSDSRLPPLIDELPQLLAPDRFYRNVEISLPLEPVVEVATDVKIAPARLVLFFGAAFYNVRSKRFPM